MEIETQENNPPTELERLKNREYIEIYEFALKTLMGSDTGEMAEMNKNGLSEYIVGGAYIRVLDIPKDTTIVSKLWKKDRLWIIISGEVIIKSENGTERITAPYIGKAPFGSKIALYTVEDTKWAAITGTESKTIEQVEEELTMNNYEYFIEVQA
jgi:hypothetical protein